MPAIANLEQLTALLGDLPPRPEHVTYETLNVTRTPRYTRQNLIIDNGYDSQVPAVLLTPNHISPTLPHCAISSRTRFPLCARQR